MCLRLVVHMVQIEVLMHSISFLMGNSARSGEAMHEIFWAAKKVYLECILGLIWSLLMNMGLGHIRFKVGLS